MEEAPQPIPKAPPEADLPSPPRKSNPSKGTLLRRRQRKTAEDAGIASWPIMQESQSAPSLPGSPGSPSARKPGDPTDIPHTWSSAARAVLGHSKRFPGPREHAMVQSATM